MTPAAFRRIALGMADAVEGSHMKHPDFRAGGKIFATLTEDEKRGTVKLTPDRQAEFVRDHPAAFEPAAGAWGRQGWTMVHLKAAEVEAVGEAMTLAWKNATTKDAKRTTKDAKKTPT
jgi:YjbR